MRTRTAARVGPIVLLLAAAACGGERPARAEAATAEPEKPPVAAGALPERLGERPATPCGWIPVPEVEAIVGPLSGPTRVENGGCFYPLPLDSLTLARRAKTRQVEAAMARAGMKSDLPAMPEDSAGVTIHVSVGVGAEERAGELTFRTLGSWVGNDKILAADPPPEGWDYGRKFVGKPNFYGRAGTVSVWVESGTFGVPMEQLRQLAARVRDRIPDLPFAAASGGTATPGVPDPCSVLTREDAEAVIGKLVVRPYRARYHGAVADPAGKSCAYYTGRHRALLVTPHFSDGRSELASIRARSGMAAAGVADPEAEAADTLEGPWEEVAIGADGQLAMRVGDRLLELNHLTSSTDAAGVIRLARVALPRLAKAP